MLTRPERSRTVRNFKTLLTLLKIQLTTTPSSCSPPSPAKRTPNFNRWLYDLPTLVLPLVPEPSKHPGRASSTEKRDRTSAKSEKECHAEDRQSLYAALATSCIYGVSPLQRTAREISPRTPSVSGYEYL
jgi:hypothetical protein